jgi:hypothetical protein
MHVKLLILVTPELDRINLLTRVSVSDMVPGSASFLWSCHVQWVQVRELGPSEDKCYRGRKATNRVLGV